APRPPKNLWQRLLVPALALAVVGLSVGAFFVLRDLFPEKKDSSFGAVQVFTSEEFNFRLGLPDKSWTADPAARADLNALVALQRSEPDAWLAVAAKDYGNGKPRDAEVVEEAYAPLQNRFKSSVEWEAPKEATLTGALEGHRALRLEFQGEANQVVGRGECYLLSHQGIGYWFFIWAPQLETAQELLEGMSRDKSNGL